MIVRNNSLERARGPLAQGNELLKRTSQEKLYQAQARAEEQIAAVVTDLDDTLVRDCIEHHALYAQKFTERFAARCGYNGKPPTADDIRRAGSVQNFFGSNFPQATDWAEHLRFSRRFHKTLPPMTDHLPEQFQKLEAQKLLPCLGLTARPQTLEELSEEIVFDLTKYFLPVIAMPEGMDYRKTAAWKLSELVIFDGLLRQQKPIFLLDDSLATVSLINSYRHPRIQALLYSDNLDSSLGQPVINWEQAPHILARQLEQRLRPR